MYIYNHVFGSAALECTHVACRRNLEYYDTCHYDAVQSCDSDCVSSGSELIIKIPKAAYDGLGAFGEQACVLHTYSNGTEMV